jgi:hypothetical protein
VRHVCPTCQEHGTPCYWVLKKRSGLFIDKGSSANGYRKALDSRQWLLLGVDLALATTVRAGGLEAGGILRAPRTLVRPAGIGGAGQGTALALPHRRRGSRMNARRRASLGPPESPRPVHNPRGQAGNERPDRATRPPYAPPTPGAGGASNAGSYRVSPLARRTHPGRIRSWDTPNG